MVNSQVHLAMPPSMHDTVTKDKVDTITSCSDDAKEETTASLPNDSDSCVDAVSESAPLDQSKENQRNKSAPSERKNGLSRNRSLGDACPMLAKPGRRKKVDTQPKLPSKRRSIDNSNMGALSDGSKTTVSLSPDSSPLIDTRHSDESTTSSSRDTTDDKPKDTAPKPPSKRRSIDLVSALEHNVNDAYMVASEDDSSSSASDSSSMNDQSFRSTDSFSIDARRRVKVTNAQRQDSSRSLVSSNQRSTMKRSSSSRSQRSAMGRTMFQRSTSSRRRIVSKQDSWDSKSFASSRQTGIYSVKSTMSTRSYLTLSSKVQTLLEMCAEVINSEIMMDANRRYQKAIHAAGTEIVDINVKLREMNEIDEPASRAKQNVYHEDLRLIGIIIGLMRTKMAIVSGEEGDFSRAIELVKGAMQVHKHQPALKGIKRDLQNVEELAGLMVLIIERLDNARKCLHDHKKLLEKMGLPTDMDAADDISISSARDRVHEMIERRMSKAKTIPIEEQDETISILCTHVIEQDKQDTAIKYLRDALQIHMVALGMKHPNTGKCLVNIARMYRGDGNDRKNESLVLGYFNATAPILFETGMCPRARGSILNDMAVIHMRRGNFDEAIKFLLDALQSYESDAVDRESSVYYSSTMQVWRNLGECYMRQDLFQSAEGAFLEALDLQRESRKVHDAARGLKLEIVGADPSIRKLINDTSIADTLTRLGKACAADGQPLRALQIYSEATTVLNKDLPPHKKRSDREVLAKRDQLTRTLYLSGQACNDIGDYKKALDMYGISLDIRNSCGAFKHDKRFSTKIHCLWCFVGIGDVHRKQKDYVKAKNQYREAASYRLAGGVTEKHPIVKMIKDRIDETEKIMDAASTRCARTAKLEKKADALIEQGALDQAIATLTQLLTIRRAALKQLKDADLDTSEQVYAIACLLQTFGFVFAKNGDDENAERAFKDAAKLFRKGKTSVEL